MQATNIINGKETLGKILLMLSMAKEGEKQSILKVLEDKIITKYPNEEKMLELFAKEAIKGKTKAILQNGILAPDFSEENISVKVIDNHTVQMRVWERGSAETWACGTGTCATVVACILNGLTDRKVLVHLLGGDLIIEWDEETNHVFMTGPATEVFSGEYNE